jgi:Fe-S cluster assembly scaffold IscU
MAYSEKVIDHYTNPKNVGTLDKAKKNVGTGLVGAPECGDVMRLQIEVDDATGVITDAKFKTFGCGSAIASSSLATEWLKGKTVDQAVEIDNMDLVEELNLPPLRSTVQFLQKTPLNRRSTITVKRTAWKNWCSKKESIRAISN